MPQRARGGAARRGAALCAACCARSSAPPHVAMETVARRQPPVSAVRRACARARARAGGARQLQVTAGGATCASASASAVDDGDRSIAALLTRVGKTSIGDAGVHADANTDAGNTRVRNVGACAVRTAARRQLAACLDACASGAPDARTAGVARTAFACEAAKGEGTDDSGPDGAGGDDGGASKVVCVSACDVRAPQAWAYGVVVSLLLLVPPADAAVELVKDRVVVGDAAIACAAGLLGLFVAAPALAGADAADYDKRGVIAVPTLLERRLERLNFSELRLDVTVLVNFLLVRWIVEFAYKGPRFSPGFTVSGLTSLFQLVVTLSALSVRRAAARRAERRGARVRWPGDRARALAFSSPDTLRHMRRCFGSRLASSQANSSATSGHAS